MATARLPWPCVSRGAADAASGGERSRMKLIWAIVVVFMVVVLSALFVLSSSILAHG